MTVDVSDLNNPEGSPKQILSFNGERLRSSNLVDVRTLKANFLLIPSSRVQGLIL